MLKKKVHSVKFPGTMTSYEFFFFFFKCSFMIKQEAYMNILDRDKLVRAGLALIDAVTFFFVLCFFFFFTFHIHIATAASIDLYCFKLT